MDLYEYLENNFNLYNNEYAVTNKKPDPILIAKKYNCEYISIICALFAYGNVTAIIKFLSSLDFSLLDLDEQRIKQKLSKSYYRFQNSDDLISLFLVLKKLKDIDSIEEIFYSGYKNEENILDGLISLIDKIHSLTNNNSQGFNFLVSRSPNREKPGQSSPLKRWNMYLRWMVRSDNIDLGLWKKIKTKDLLLPLDTHTFKLTKDLNLLQRKSYDLKSVIEVTQNLKKYDNNDPSKYDFALYRIGQKRYKM